MQVIITGIATGESGSIIPPVKAVRATTGMGLREAKYLVDKVRAGEPQVLPLDYRPSPDHLDDLRAQGLVLTVRDAPSKADIRHVLMSMPQHLTVAEVLAVLDAVA